MLAEFPGALLRAWDPLAGVVPRAAAVPVLARAAFADDVVLPRLKEFALLCADADSTLAACVDGGVARVTTERLPTLCDGTPVVRGDCPPVTEECVGLALAVFIRCALLSAEDGTAPPTLLTIAPEVNAALEAEVTPLRAIMFVLRMAFVLLL